MIFEIFHNCYSTAAHRCGVPGPVVLDVTFHVLDSGKVRRIIEEGGWGM